MPRNTSHTQTTNSPPLRSAKTSFTSDGQSQSSACQHMSRIDWPETQLTTVVAIDRLPHQSVTLEMNLPSDRLESAKQSKVAVSKASDSVTRGGNHHRKNFWGWAQLPSADGLRLFCPPPECKKNPLLAQGVFIVVEQPTDQNNRTPY